MNRSFHHSSAEHLPHPWAGGWRCWLCPIWSEHQLQGRCAAAVEVSLSHVPGSLHRRRSCTRVRWVGE